MLSAKARNLAYLALIGTQLFGMLALDLVPFYPKALYEAPSAPLHFLISLRKLYVSFSEDPLFVHPSHEPWFQAFLYIEGLVQFPLAVYLVSTLTRPGVRTELAALVFGSVTGMTSVTCLHYLWTLGEEVVSAEKKAMLVYGEYLPFAIIPILMVIDMWTRLENRVKSAQVKPKRF